MNLAHVQLGEDLFVAHHRCPASGGVPPCDVLQIARPTATGFVGLVEVPWASKRSPPLVWRRPGRDELLAVDPDLVADGKGFGVVAWDGETWRERSTSRGEFDRLDAHRDDAGRIRVLALRAPGRTSPGSGSGRSPVSGTYFTIDARGEVLVVQALPEAAALGAWGDRVLAIPFAGAHVDESSDAGVTFRRYDEAPIARIVERGGDVRCGPRGCELGGLVGGSSVATRLGWGDPRLASPVVAEAEPPAEPATRDVHPLWLRCTAAPIGSPVKAPLVARSSAWAMMIGGRDALLREELEGGVLRSVSYGADREIRTTLGPCVGGRMLQNDVDGAVCVESEGVDGRSARVTWFAAHTGRTGAWTLRTTPPRDDRDRPTQLRWEARVSRAGIALQQGTYPEADIYAGPWAGAPRFSRRAPSHWRPLWTAGGLVTWNGLRRSAHAPALLEVRKHRDARTLEWRVEVPTGGPPPHEAFVEPVAAGQQVALRADVTGLGRQWSSVVEIVDGEVGDWTTLPRIDRGTRFRPCTAEERATEPSFVVRQGESAPTLAIEGEERPWYLTNATFFGARDACLAAWGFQRVYGSIRWVALEPDGRTGVVTPADADGPLLRLSCSPATPGAAP